ncbi:uncharacterized protein EKO05_0003622 [Ascochyta rabiei]|uniref:Uncharacterized protein n=1 Tax=Didymella rabiei TaxID=5454 RepID=A0A163M229_DIDRA|nr:uncharacterized protein EKO05_0003622 [Ascochyta rabiei]KZM28329.1 hypothetical protein ST47_g524 [Ascochyta rabiei]UPX13095.1 hypothetical protein EKO05_0003622 [Ascochyta rabiei]
MARTKKPSAEDAGELMVSVEVYTRTRDSVIVSLTNLQAGLTHVQNGLNDLLRAYMEHTTSVIAGEDGALDKLQLPPNITATANAAIEAASSTANGIVQAMTAGDKAESAAETGKPAKGIKRKREKKEKDPNAPKKPLTAAFLYAQSARPIVRGDLEAALGPEQKLEPNAVNLEVNKRWNEMPEEDKETWRQSYRDSMEQWKEEMAAYTAKNASAAIDLHDDDEASEADAEIELEAAADSDASSEDEEPAPAKAPSPPVKTPRANKRQKTVQNSTVNGASAPIVAAASPIPLPRSASAAAPPVPVAETPAKKERKKKEKPAPQPIAPAPAKETSPEEGSKKKTKSGRSTRNNEVELTVQDKENVAAPEKEKKKRERKRKGEVAAA